MEALIPHPQHNVAEPLLLEEVFVALHQRLCVLDLVCDGLGCVSGIQPAHLAVSRHYARDFVLHFTEHIACNAGT